MTPPPLLFEREPAALQATPGEPAAMSDPMQPHQQRVADEHAELDDRLVKLNAFINSDKFSAVSQTEQDLLIRQSVWMTGHLGVLVQRVTLHRRQAQEA